MFRGCSSLASAELSGLDTSKATDMSYMFHGCSSLASADLSGLDTSKVKNMSSMFYGCSSLASADLSVLDTPILENMSDVFKGCSSLISVNLSGIDTSNSLFLGRMFEGCSKLVTISFGEKTRLFASSGVPIGIWVHQASGKRLTEQTLSTSIGEGLDSAPAGVWHRGDSVAYRIAYNANGGDGTTEPQSVSFIDESITLRTNGFTHDETIWEFAGWNTKADGSGSEHAGGEILQTDDMANSWGLPAGQAITLYAQWRMLNAYTVSFDPGEGSGAMPPLYGQEGRDTAIPDSSFYRFDHTLSGWKDLNTGEIFDVNGPIPANKYQQGEAVTLTAQWKRNDHHAIVQDGSFTVALCSGEKMVLRDLPAGTTYRIYEETPSGWLLAMQNNASGAIKPAAVSASVFTNDYRPGTASATIAATKLLDGKPSSAIDGFTFSLYEGGKLAQGPIVAQANGAVQFNPITYTQEGEHEYVIRENAGKNPDIKFDAHEERVRVHVTDDGRGNLSAAVSYVTDEGAVFENTRKLGTLRVSKQARDMTDAAANDTFTAHVTLGNGEVHDVALKPGSSHDISGIPAGTTYTVTETDLPRGWTQAGGTALTGVIKAESTVEATLVNRYEPASATGHVRVTKAWEGRDWLNGEKAMFKLIAVDSAPLPTDTLALATADEPTAEFDAITFTTDDLRNADGTYTTTRDFTYLIREDVPDEAAKAAGVTYDTATRRAVVRLTASGSNGLYATTIYDDGEYTPPTFTNTYVAEPCGLAVDAYKLMDGALLTEGIYSFDLYDDNDDIDATGTTPGIDDKNPQAGNAPFKKGDVVVSPTVSGAAGGHAHATAASVSFTAPGTYRYIMRERIPDGAVSSEGGVVYDAAATPMDVRDGYSWTHAGVNYDGAPVYVTVDVSDVDASGAHTGRLAATVAYQDAGTPIGGYDGAGTGAEFRNRYRTTDATATISADKRITGREPLDSDFFVFELTPVDSAPLRVTGPDGHVTYPGVLADTVRREHPRATFDMLTYTYDDLANADGTHDRQRTFTYRVHEAQYDAEGFDRNPGDGSWLFAGFTYAPDQYVKVTLTDDGTGKLNVTYGEGGTATMEPPAFTNAYRIAAPVHAQIPVAKQIADHTGNLLVGWAMDDGIHDWSDDAFTFELRSSSDDAPMPDGAQARTDGQAGKCVRVQVRLANDDDVSAGALFGDMAFWKGGTYNYTIVEVLPDGVSFNHPVNTGEQLAYDTSSRGVRVKVVDNGDGTLAQPQVTVTGATADEVMVTGAAAAGVGIMGPDAVMSDLMDDVPVFTNQEAGDTDIVLKTHKLLEGAQLQGDMFDFELYEAAANEDMTHWTPVGDPIAHATNLANGLVAGAPREFTVDDVVHEGEHHEKTFYYMGREKVPDDAVNTNGVRYEDASADEQAAGGFTYEGVTFANDWSLFAVNVREKVNNEGEPTANHVYIQKLVVGEMAADGTIVGELRTLRDLGDTVPSNEELVSDEWYQWRDGLDARPLGQGWPRHTNTFAATGMASVTVEKRVTGRAAEDTPAFGFTLTPISGAPLRTAADGEQLPNLSGSASAGQSMTFDRLAFTQDDLKNYDEDGNWEGTYATSKSFEYTIHELAPDSTGADSNDGSGDYSAAGYTYAADQVVKVNVTNDGSGALRVTYGDEEADRARPREFVNAYAANEPATVRLEAAKIISGRNWKEGDSFTFKLAPGTNTAGIDTPMPAGATADADGAAYATVDVTHESVDVGGGTNARKAAFEDIDFTRPGTYRYLVTEIVPDGDAAIAGISYAAGTEHDITVRVTDDGAGGLEAAVRYGAHDAVVPFVNGYTPQAATLQLQGVKTVEGAALQSGKFLLSLYETDSSFEVPLWAAPKDTAVVLADDEGAGGSGSAGTATFSALRYTTPGTFRYVIREAVPEGADAQGRFGSWTYDTHDCKVTVLVTDEGGELQAEATYDNGGASADGGDRAAAAFTNRYEATGSATLSLTKEITGREWRDDEEFTFTLRPLNRGDDVEAPQPASGGDTVTIGAQTDGHATSFGTLGFTQDDLAIRDTSGAVRGYVGSRTFDYAITEANAGRTVEGLQHPEATTAHVTVSSAGDDGLYVTVSYGGTLVDGEWANATSALLVTNAYVPTPVKVDVPVQKLLTGEDRSWESYDAFTFELRAGRNTAGVTTPLPEGARDGVAKTTLDATSARVGDDGNWRAR